jgi:hypothetical protein
VAGLQIPLMAQHPWIAVTTDGTQTQVWDSRQALTLWEYLSTGVVVGWNVIEFDLVLIGNKVIHDGRIAPLQIVDLFDRVRQKTKSTSNPYGISYKLEDVAMANLGIGKLGDSARIPAIFQTDLDAVIEHCKRDVYLEQQLFLCALGEGMILPSHTNKNGFVTPRWVYQV